MKFDEEKFYYLKVDGESILCYGVYKAEDLLMIFLDKIRQRHLVVVTFPVEDEEDFIVFEEKEKKIRIEKLTEENFGVVRKFTPFLYNKNWKDFEDKRVLDYIAEEE